MWKKNDKKETAVEKTNTPMDITHSDYDILKSTKAANSIPSNKQKGTL